MKLHILILLLFCRLFVIENQALARGPAVEPVTGLSIEEYNTTPPNNQNGFDFNHKNNSRKVAAINRAPERSIESLYDKSSSEYVFLVILGILPFIIWLALMKTLDSIERKYNKPFLVKDDEDNEKKSDDDKFPWVS